MPDLVSYPVELPLLLSTQLDSGEASVIQTAKIKNISTVVIDERLGRRIARLQNLKVTGSTGILVKAIRLKILPSLDVCFDCMEQKGIWISQNLKDQALKAIRSP